MNTEVLEPNTENLSEISREAITKRIDIRPAKKNDQGQIAELMYSSGAEIFDYIHTIQDRNHSLDYIESELRSGRGLCSWKLLTVAELDGEVVATGTFYDLEGYKAMSSQSLIAMISYYGLGFLPRLRRAIDTTKLVRAPKPDELYLANFGVAPALRGSGIGTMLLKQRIAEAKASGYRIIALDVADHNHKAEALYHRLGFAVTKSKSMKGRDGKEYAGKKMELFL